MASSDHIETEQLLAEIGRYLAAVELFRALGCEPRWRPETARPAAPVSDPALPSVFARRAH
jgi:hypothetical protein